MFVRLLIVFGCVVACQCAVSEAQNPSAVLQSLVFESPEKLASDARKSGDAVRGASVFYQPELSCATCHATADDGTTPAANVGPDLAAPKPDLTDAGIVDSILRPSKTISKGYETIQVLTVDGKVLVGVLIGRTDESIRLRDPATGKVVEVLQDDIEEDYMSDLSIMPEGVVSQIADRQAFLDLVRYLIEIRDGGPARAQELRPGVMPTLTPLPDYESRIDHAGMLASLNEESLQRGEAIYIRICQNCHGTVDEPGSLPTSLRFASGKFKNGFDPHSMYQTLTHGFGLMTPQRSLVPQEKYDVIHYIRESFLKPHNPTQFASVDDNYLDGLPKGDTRGPDPVLIQSWQQMNYGPNLMATYEIGDDATNFAYKGHAIRLDDGPGGITQGEARIVYEHDTMRVAAAWLGKDFIDYNGINFNGAHQKHPRIVGDVVFANANGAGWANPIDGSFDEVRQPGRDGRLYGPLPRDWINYQGTYTHGSATILRYQVGGVEVFEQPTLQTLDGVAVFNRSFSVAASERELTVRVADVLDAKTERLLQDDHAEFWISHPDGDGESIVIGSTGDTGRSTWHVAGGQLRLRLVQSKNARDFNIHVFRIVDRNDAEQKIASLVSQVATGRTSAKSNAIANDRAESRWPEVLTTAVKANPGDGPFAVDTIVHPAANPWSCRMRLTGIDFYADGESAVLCDWDGNVWKVSGLHESNVTWKRIASGLFQPLGIKIRDGEIFVSCRDQICRLHDLNGDGETDYYESFNHDHQVTDHFHEFAMGLQTDDEGNFYYAKSACHALAAKVPQHGTLLKVSADGKSTEILANGFRAANGVCLNDDGSFFVTDQEGHWNPKNRINWVRPGRFYGNMLGYHDVTDSRDEAMEPPMCWITNSFDRSPSELLWIKSKQWGALEGSLLNLSYGYGKIYIVPHEVKGDQLKGDQMQGGMCELPMPQFPTGTMRGRFHPTDGHLYLTGMYSWAGTQEADGGFFRVRYTGKPAHVPLTVHCHGTTIQIGLTDDVNPTSVLPTNFSVKRWKIKRTKDYGSPHHDEEMIQVASARWDGQQRQITLEIPDLAETWCQEIKCSLKSTTGQSIERVIHHSIFNLDDESSDVAMVPSAHNAD
jgi:putative heme-binding domain-containing protein